MSPPSFFSPDGSLNGGLSKKRPNQGDRVVCILNKKPQLGILKYIGTTHFAEGEWCGILLDEACGKNDGSVRGVRYFRCKNKHGIFVHSHKVRTAYDITLSRLNLLESPCSQQSPEKKEDGVLNSEQSMSSKNVEVARADDVVYKHRDVKSLRLTRRNRSVSLDRYLFLKAKQLAKGLNIFLHNAEKSEEMNTSTQNLINRSRSMPKISKKNFSDSNEYCLNSEMAPLEKNLWHEKMELNVVNKEPISVGVDRNKPMADVPHLSDDRINNLVGDHDQETLSANSTLENSSTRSRQNGVHTSVNQNSANGEKIAIHKKVGHAVSLDTHLMIETGQLTVMPNSENNEYTCTSHLSVKEDPFIQGRHCSCPSLHCADHFSESITTCLDLGRVERSIIPEAENDNRIDTGKAARLPSNDEIHHKHIGYSHAQSDTLQKISDDKFINGESLTFRDSELTHTRSWPCLTSTPKKSLRHCSSSSDINTCSTLGRSGDYEDVFDERIPLILVPVKPISNNTVQRCLNLNNIDSVSQVSGNTAVNKTVKSLPRESQDQAVDAGSNYTDSLSGSQASLSSTGTSDGKGKKMSATRRIPSSVKGAKSKSTSIPTTSNNVSKPAQQKQFRLGQTRQQQNQKVHLSSENKLPNTTATSAEYNTGVKIQKRHTLATIPDLKSFVPRPAVSKRQMSAGIKEQSSRDESRPSKLPVKKTSTPSQISKPAVPPKLEKKTDTASVQRRHSAAASRPPVAPVVKRESGLARSDSKVRKPSKASLPQKTSGKEKDMAVIGQKVMGGQTPTSVKGPKGSVPTAGSKPQTSRVTRSSSSVKGN